jgi:hypothetical protein
MRAGRSTRAPTPQAAGRLRQRLVSWVAMQAGRSTRRREMVEVIGHKGEQLGKSMPSSLTRERAPPFCARVSTAREVHRTVRMPPIVHPRLGKAAVAPPGGAFVSSLCRGAAQGAQAPTRCVCLRDHSYMERNFCVVQGERFGTWSSALGVRRLAEDASQGCCEAGAAQPQAPGSAGDGQSEGPCDEEGSGGGNSVGCSSLLGACQRGQAPAAAHAAEAGDSGGAAPEPLHPRAPAAQSEEARNGEAAAVEGGSGRVPSAHQIETECPVLHANRTKCILLASHEAGAGRTPGCSAEAVLGAGGQRAACGSTAARSPEPAATSPALEDLQLKKRRRGRSELERLIPFAWDA